MWFVISSEMSAYKIADRVRLSINEDDKVFVSRLSTDSAWCGVEEKGSEWAQEARVAKSFLKAKPLWP